MPCSRMSRSTISLGKPWGREGPYDVDDSFHEIFVTMAYIAAVTERVGLASGILILPQRQTALVAKQAAQLDIVSGGRLRLGIGTGWIPVEYEAGWVRTWRVRGRRQAEQIELMNQLWTNRKVTFDGEFDRVHHAGIKPLPIQQPIPIWLGGRSGAGVETRCEIRPGVAATVSAGRAVGRPPGTPAYLSTGRGGGSQVHLVSRAGCSSNIGGPDQWQTEAEALGDC